MKKERPRVTPARAAVERPVSRVSREVWRRRALLMLALWAFALLAYSNSFRAGLALDNASVILNDPRIRAATPENLHLILTKDYWYYRMTTGLYRPLTTFSYLLNYAIFGNGPHPAGYHWVNFALHAVNIALVYLLGLLVFQETKLKEHLALALAAVWAVHPVLTESVTNIVGRADLLAAFGVLAGLLCHVQGGAASGWRKLAWLSGLALATTIGLFSKESAVVVLAAMVIYDLAFRQTWRARASGYLALAVSFPVFFYVRDQVLANLPSAVVPFGDNPLVGAGFWTARLTAIKVMESTCGCCSGPATFPATIPTTRSRCSPGATGKRWLPWRYAPPWRPWRLLVTAAANQSFSSLHSSLPRWRPPPTS